MSAGHVSRRCGCPAVKDDHGGTLRGDDGRALREHRPGCQPTWQYVHDLPPGPGGKRRQKTKGGFPTRREAQRALRSSLEQTERGYVPSVGKLTVGNYLDAWLTSKVNLRWTTAAAYSSHIRLHLKPAIGHVRLVELRHEHVENLFADLRDRPANALSARTLQRVKATLNSALNDAVKRRQIPYNPAAHVELPRVHSDQRTVWSMAELHYFLNRINDDDLYPALHLAAMTGMRRGEIAGLRWADLDLPGKRLRVANQRVEAGRRIGDMPPKTVRSERTISLDDTTVVVLRSHAAREQPLAEIRGHQYLFSGPAGDPVRPELIYRRLQTLAKEAGLPKIRLHDLRHTHATHALEAGVPMKVVQERLGHSSMYLTADTYSHVRPSVAEEAAELVARSVFQAHGLSLAGREQAQYNEPSAPTEPGGSRRSDVVGPVGLEPTTHGLKVHCSAN